MGPDQVVANRFEIEAEAGAGSMGRVYRALDRSTGEIVALKMLGAHAQLAERFAREAAVLAEVAHPGIVRYIAHGSETDGAQYLAMEWIEGETLAKRLARAPLSLEETIALARRSADALSALHRRGIVHRDLKPSNILLANHSIDQAKLVDLGVARRQDEPDLLTEPGTIIGTPGYMAPEQARGERDIDARADVFALGALLFKCLAGRSAFEGSDALTVLLKVVLEDPPPILEVCPGVPLALADLVDDMLAKSPDQRPVDAAAVLERVGMLEARPPRTSSPPPGLTSTERRVVCLVLAKVGRSEVAASAFARGALRDVIEPYGGRLDLLADGSALVALSGAGAPSDLAVRAARCALSMRSALPRVPMAVVAGRAVVTARSPMREAIDRGVRLLGESRDAIRIDEVTAGLLDARFDLGGDASGLTLLEEREIAGGARTLLGKPTKIVGREQELGILETVYGVCVAEPVSRAALVLGPAGIGKSRLRYEFVRRIAQRDDRAQFWVGRADPMSAGSAFALIASALRNGLGLESEPGAIARQKLIARVGRHFEGQERARVADFIGEIIGVPPVGEPSIELRVARNDATRMGYQMRRAFEEFVHAECEAGPLVLVLEDLHWGDLPTVSFVDGAIRHLAELPFMVLALGRPDVNDLYPKLWADRNVQTIQLGVLTKKASEKLVREVLGADIAAPLLQTVVERASGNAFYLEELIRAVAEGKGETLPETIVAMAAARLDRLEPEARRVLRAASVFGQVFWKTGVGVLLGERAGGSSANRRGIAFASADTTARLDSLVLQEVITRHREGDLAGEDGFAFRHSLVREAAYSMLTDADRELGHRLAATWLEQAGLRDAMTLAEHWERGKQPERAIGWYGRAAEQALEGNDLDTALARARHALDLGAEGEVRGALELSKAEAHRWRGELAETESAASNAMNLLRRGGEAWYFAARELGIATATHGRHDRLAELAAELARELPDEEARGAYAIVSAGVAVRLYYSGKPELAETLFQRLEEAASEAGDNPAVAAEIHQARGYRAHVEGDLSALLRSATLAKVEFERAGELRNAVQQVVNGGYAHLELGDHLAAEVAQRAAIEEAERLGLAAVVALAKHNLGLALARRGALDEARAVEREAVVSARALGHSRMECGAKLYLALILAQAGALDAAALEAESALESSAAAPLLRPKAQAALAHVLLLQGETELALGAARKAQSELEELGTIEEGEGLVRLVYAEALRAAGHDDEARAAIVAARARLEARAAKIGEPGHRESFLANVPENARTMELEEEWGRARRAAS